MKPLIVEALEIAINAYQYDGEFNKAEKLEDIIEDITKISS